MRLPDFRHKEMIWAVPMISIVMAGAVSLAADETSSGEDKGTSSEHKRIVPVRRESEGFDIIPERWRESSSASSAARAPKARANAFRAVRTARLYLKFGEMEHGNLQEFDRASAFLDLAAAPLAESEPDYPAEGAETLAHLKRQTLEMRGAAATTLFGRFPLIRAFGFQVEEDEDLEVHSYSMPGEARRRAIRSALIQIGKSAATYPVHALILVPGESPEERVSGPLASLVDAEADEALARVASIMLYSGRLRGDLDPMPAWDSPDPAYDPICRQFLQQIDPHKEGRTVMLIMVREFVGDLGDRYWVQAQQKTFEASSLEKAKDAPEKLEYDKARMYESLTYDRSQFSACILGATAALFLASLGIHEGLSLTVGPASGDWQKWLAIPSAGFLMGLILTPLIMFALKRWLPAPQTHALWGAWWPCTAGGLSVILPAGVFRLVAGSVSRYLPSLSCHGRWGIAFVPVALGACAAWVRPACYAAAGFESVHVIAAIGVTASLLVYCFGRAVDVADQFPVALTPIAVGLAAIFGAGAFLGSPLVLWLVSAGALVTTVSNTYVRRRSAALSRGIEESGRTTSGYAHRPRTPEQLRIALEAPMYQPPPEFQRLRQSIEKSGFTQSTWIGLVGPSASGKTAAARQLISELQATDQQLQVLVGRCSENSTPFQPFREALEELGVSAALIASRAQGGDVNSIFDRLADELIPFWDFFSSEGGDEEKNGPVRDDLRAAVTNALLTFAKRQPVLLFLDDIQWLDEDSAMLLKHLRENFAPGRETPLIIIVASRDPQPLERLELKDSVFSLTPPSSTEQVQILENSLGIENASARRLVDALGVMSQEAGGMFWLIRAVRELAAANAFEPTSRGLKLQARYLRSGELPVPAAMRAKLMESVRASGDLQPVLECAALLGERFRVNDLAECLDMSRLTLLQILRHLERELQLVRDIPSDQECYAFSSTFLLQIVRDELGAGNSHSKRPASKIAREFHVRIARVLERRQPRTLQLASSIADHYLAAGVSHAARSLDFCLGAARLARERHAFLDARKFLTMAEQSARLAGRSMNFSDERRRIDSEEAEMTGRNSSA